MVGKPLCAITGAIDRITEGGTGVRGKRLGVSLGAEVGDALGDTERTLFSPMLGAMLGVTDEESVGVTMGSLDGTKEGSGRIKIPSNISLVSIR